MHAEKCLSFVFVAEKAAGCFAFTNQWVPLGSAHITVLMEQFLQWWKDREGERKGDAHCSASWSQVTDRCVDVSRTVISQADNDALLYTWLMWSASIGYTSGGLMQSSPPLREPRNVLVYMGSRLNSQQSCYEGRAHTQTEIYCVYCMQSHTCNVTLAAYYTFLIAEIRCSLHLNNTTGVP